MERWAQGWDAALSDGEVPLSRQVDGFAADGFHEVAPLGGGQSAGHFRGADGLTWGACLDLLEDAGADGGGIVMGRKARVHARQYRTGSEGGAQD